MDYSNKILELTEKDKIIGHIYVITCCETLKQYVGQAASHTKNNKKYRPNGYLGRFQQHISEAITNTRKSGGSVYLNSAIRKYGKDNFIVELIETCHMDEIDEKEISNIKKFNTLNPNGYNLTIGGKTNPKWVSSNSKIDDEGLRVSEKRGRDFGYVHKKSTIEKMKKYHEDAAKNPNYLVDKQHIFRNTLTNYHQEKRAEKLANLNVVFDKDFKKYIRPQKKGDEIVTYVIRINRERHCRLRNPELSLEEKYKLLYDALKDAYEIQQSRKKEIE
jgi:hypothetical protein